MSILIKGYTEISKKIFQTNTKKTYFAGNFLPHKIPNFGDSDFVVSSQKLQVRKKM